MWLFDAFVKRIVSRGELTVVGTDGKRYAYGRPDPAFGRITLRLLDDKVADDIARHPRLGFGEAYMNGRVAIEGGDILDFLRFILGNNRWEDGSRIGGPRGPKKYVNAGLRRLDRLNWESRSKRNVAHHYDLSDRLYDLFLDADRQYSCAYFADPESSLDRAQADKKAHIAAKLDLRPGQRVLDIGCGWGGMALYLHRIADVDVLGVTLSEEQLKVARARAAEAGVDSRVKFELIDYRQLRGRFDRIVSVGMFEHVGPPNYRRFFDQCARLLAEDGVMLLHTIGRLGGPGTTDAFTSKYIFPGGYNPALSEIVSASEPAKLIASDVETLRLHYALTLQRWYRRTVFARAEIEMLYDARFYRLWTFYLAGAVAAFEHGGLCNYQIQFIRRRDTLPITRDYMAAAERGYRERESAPPA